MNPDQLITLIYFSIVATWFFAGVSANDEDIYFPAICFIVLGAVFVAGYQCGQKTHFDSINSNFQLLPK